MKTALKNTPGSSKRVSTTVRIREVKLDGFRGLAATIMEGSRKNRNHNNVCLPLRNQLYSARVSAFLTC